tara:strand:- start:525 stop:923 length:399 start_codon:yes stop_codon:yes gene_type:complete
MIMILSKFDDYLDIIARVLMSGLFLINGYNKIIYFEGTVDWMAMYDLPAFFIYPAIILELFAPILIIFGYKTKLASLLLSGFCLLTAIIFLTDFSSQSELNGFLKNVALAGGFLLLTINGPKKFSLDNKVKK